METKTKIHIDLSDFTPGELSKLEAAAESQKMTLEQYVVFLIHGVQTP